MLAKLLPSQRAMDVTGMGANETTGLSIYDWAKMFAPGAVVSYGGNAYQAFKVNGSANSGAKYYQSNPIVFTCVSIRILLFSEARFQWQQLRDGRPGNLFGTKELAVLEEPWPGHTTRDMLAEAELDVFVAGNSYWIRRSPTEIFRLDPSKVDLLTAAATEDELRFNNVGTELLGYIYKPDPRDMRTWTFYEPTEVCHYKPYPDVNNRFIGMSWISPCIAEIQTDDAIAEHKFSTISNGARLSYVVSMAPEVSPEQFELFVDQFHRQHDGPENANRTLFLGGGADVKTVGQTFENLALQATQGSTEVRIASCAGVPPVIVGFSEGLKGSTLNAGNYGQARRRLTDGTMRPLWGAFSGSMQSLITKPPGADSRLWYDDRDIAFCREDLADQAAIMTEKAAALTSLIHGGWKPDAAIDAVDSGDLERLIGEHTGLTSVQLLPPGNTQGGGEEPFPAIDPAPAVSNGNGKKPPLPVAP